MKNTFPLLLLTAVLLSQCKRDTSVEIDLGYTPDKVTLFAENAVSTNLYERDMAISPGGDEIVFTLSDYKQARHCLVIMKKLGPTWSDKEMLSFSGRYHDMEPFFAADGNRLFFASDRPIYSDSARSDYNIWVVERTPDGWGDPEPLPSTVNSLKDEFYPAVSKNNNLYFTSVRENGVGSEDIFLSRYVNGIYSDPVPLDTNINTATYEFNAYISPEEDLLVFSSYGRQDDLGGGDLYVSRKDENGNWMPAKNMGPVINSANLDYCPFIDYPRGNFYFTSDRMLPGDKRIETPGELETMANSVLNGMGNLYRVKVDSVQLK